MNNNKSYFIFNLIFTMAALVLLVLKFSAYPAISWWLIVGVFLFPLMWALFWTAVVLLICGIVFIYYRCCK